MLGNLLLSGETGPPTRLFTVKIAVDEEGSLNKQKKYLTKLIKEVSADFEKKFNMGFSITGWETWQSSNSARSIDSLAPSFFKQLGKKNTAVIFGVTFQEDLKGEYGLAFYEEGYVLIRAVKDPALQKKILKHEICHLFGAAHVDDRNSLMDRFLRGNKLKEKNKRIIELHRERNFQGVDSPAPRQNREKLISLYTGIARENEKLPAGNFSPKKRKDLRHWLTGVKISKKKSAVVQEAYVRLENVYIYLALLYIGQKKYGETISRCNRALRINPQLYEAYNLMGIAFRRSGEIDKAIRHYHKALELDRSSGKIYYNLGIAYAKRGERSSQPLKGGENGRSTFGQRNADSAAYFPGKTGNDFQPAASAYLKAIELNPNFAHPHNNLGYILLEQGDIEGAIARFREAISLNPYYGIARSNYANALLEQGQPEAAFAAVGKALELDPRLPGAHNILGMIYSQKGELEKAEQAYKKAISCDPVYYKGYYNLGNLYLNRGELKKAYNCFQKALTANPGFKAVYSALGDCYIMMGKFERAEEALKKILEIDSTNAKVYLNMSFIKIKKGDFTATVDFAKKALRLDPGLELAHQNLAIAFFMTSRLVEAEQEFTKAVEINPSLKQAWSSLGDIYLGAGKIEKARSAYEKCLQLDPKDGKVLNNLAVVYYYKKDYKQAKKFVEKAERLGFKVNEGFKKELEKHL